MKRLSLQHLDEKAQQSVQNLQKDLGVDALIAQLLVLRGVTDFDQAKRFFRPSLSDLHSPFLMKDMDIAVDRILQAIQQGENIMVYGDYDVDGTTAVSLVYSFLKNYTPNLITYIPDRYKEGYGISLQGIDFASEKKVSLIIALDCGIKAIKQVEYARKKGIDFIIADHHMPGEQIPEATAVLNPKQKDCAYPYKELCGCGVGFKLIQALAEKLSTPQQQIFAYLDLVVVAIAADIVPITGENRILAYHGLQIFDQTQRPGFLAMKRLFSLQHFTISDIVFKIAPRINAAGRIKHGNYAVELLTEFNFEQAVQVAREIDEFNTFRKELDQNITTQALQQIIDNQEEKKSATVVFQPEWHKGVIGIVASRLIETYYRPTLVFTRSGEVLAASARSVKNFDVYEALEACSEHILQFGGHKYAAGLTLLESEYENFKRKFNEVVEQTLAKEHREEEIVIDAEINLNELTPKNLRILKQFEPHGPGNMHPVFLSKNVFDVGGFAKAIGKEQEHLKMYLKQDNSKVFDAIAFGEGHRLNEIGNEQRMQIVYSLNENSWQEQTNWQMQIKNFCVL
ncbi:single-stranded-DNA-specific exonuclease RecJ [Avrilella dinanensis]|uniref:Single-stranded-DNA-specific exonuclease RecJ n=1 Tax=Avrilella dinanensis TaxID=2008672 RepID=A0A2M9R4A5_9FLAO|nr:single-stranded-DNA-specific exonuclease RecJ [Avrilella dinanensis]PJR03691.1 single-stranded-DNA-specific exonuclease RecJ [Avrilella dinanensis]